MVKEELKKIWRPGILLALLVIGFVFYTMRLEFYIKYFPNGPYDSGMIELCTQMVEKYGTSLSEIEYKEVQKSQADIKTEADMYVRSYEIGKKYGINTYEEFCRFREEAFEEVSGEHAADQNERYADAMRMQNYMESKETENVEGRLNASAYITSAYEAFQNYAKNPSELNDGTYTEKEWEKVSQDFFGETQLWRNILPYEVPEAIGAYLGNVLIWICLSICVLLSPLLVHDRMSRMQALQYSSRHGRRIYGSQFASVLISAGLLTTINLIIFGGLFAAHGTSVFFPCRMSSFLMNGFCWPDWTHGRWCLMLVGMCYLISFGIAGAVFFLSGSCTNYITMLLKILPLFVVSVLVSGKIINYAFYFNNILYEWSGIPYAELAAAAGIFVLGMILCGIGRWKVAALERI